MKTRERFYWFLCIGVISTSLQCNTAPSGFSAPYGSEVTVSTTAPIESLSKVIVRVKVPMGAEEESQLVPGNEIYVEGVCTYCNIYDRAEGQNVTVPDKSRLQAVSNPYIFKTNSQGVYELVIEFQPPMNYGKTSYTAIFTADIGVSSADTSISVTE